MVEGELTFKVGGETITATAGESVTVEPGTAHKFWNAVGDGGPVPLRDQPGAPVREADRDDVRARERRQDEQEGPAEPASARRDREPPLRRRPAAVPARLHPEARVWSSAPRPAGCSATSRTTSRPRPPTCRSRSESAPGARLQPDTGPSTLRCLAEARHQRGPGRVTPGRRGRARRRPPATAVLPASACTRPAAVAHRRLDARARLPPPGRRAAGRACAAGSPPPPA